ncbi:SDR family oxidoreductase [Streptomyces inhibens]|uniref:SDR family oxidoreductase n=1 Tax=Streptomyces inhibens TaxID=2293571 RepID=UPI00402AAA78
MTDSHHKTVLITGCSSGFGLAAAVALAGRGWRVFATMRDTGRRAALDESVRATGGSVEVVPLDVTDARSVESGVAAVLEATGGRLDALVNNAGIGDAGFFEDTPDDQVRHVMETNFFGALAVTRAALPALRERRGGRIVVVSSVAAFAAQAALSVYAASKWAVEGWAEALSVEMAPFGVQVALVEPGAYRTAIWDSAVVASDPDSPYAELRETVETRFRDMIDKTARDPKEVGARIAGLLEARMMPLRSPVGPDAKGARLMRQILPTRTRLGILRRMVGLPGEATEPPSARYSDTSSRK